MGELWQTPRTLGGVANRTALSLFASGIPQKRNPALGPPGSQAGSGFCRIPLGEQTLRIARRIAFPTTRCCVILARMTTTGQRASAEILADRQRFVSGGVSTPRLVVTRAEGARVTDADGRVFLDFAGGIGCQNTGHRFAPVVEAIQRQADEYLHQCFMVGVYEPYVDTCRLLSELSPCAGDQQKSILVNSGAEANENAVKIARAATGRPAVVVFDNAFHGRTLLTMTMTSKVAPYKAGFGPFAPEVYRAPSPYPYRGVTTDDALAGLRKLFKSEVDPRTVACALLEPVQGEGGFIEMPADYPARLAELLREHGILYVDDEVQSGVGRTGRMWAIEHYADVEPDLLVSGKSIGGGLPLAAVTGRAELMDAVPPGGLGGTFGGNPLSCAAAVAVLEAVREPDFLARASEVGKVARARLEELAARHPELGEVRGLGPMLGFELVEQTPDRAKAIVDAAFERGLLLLSCGLYGNVIRLLPALTISDEELAEGLDLLEESLAAG
jgi:4-aminobutyrate aminotransferase